MYGLVFLGGALGSAARQLWVHAWPWPEAWSILAANALGSFGIGFVMSMALEADRLDDRWRLFLTTGVLGGFTTFSTYEVVAWEMGRRSAAIALLYAFGSVAATLLAVIFGQGLARWIWLRSPWLRARDPRPD
ncbi:MAG: CrcB family protein [Clostridia bacterium]|nr:CrcB family protein [Clostridia bacterium]